MREWAGKRYWLVGASEGLGRSLAEVMSEAGIELILSARNEARLSELAETLPGRVDVKALDISDLDAVLAAKDEIGEIDGMVFLAGVYWPMPAQNLDPNKAEAMVDVNFTGAMRVVSAVLPEFVARDAGHILITGSLSAFRGLPGAVGYAASKAGTMVLAESLYCDLRKSGVQVQTVNPGFIKTRLTDKNDFSMPQLMEPDHAAREIWEHMQTDRFMKSYPSPFAWLFRLGALMPGWLYYRIFS